MTKNELKQALKEAKTLWKINAIMEIAVDSLTALTLEEVEELKTIATERKQAIYNSRYF